MPTNQSLIPCSSETECISILSTMPYYPLQSIQIRWKVWPFWTLPALAEIIYFWLYLPFFYLLVKRHIYSCGRYRTYWSGSSPQSVQLDDLQLLFLHNYIRRAKLLSINSNLERGYAALNNSTMDVWVERSVISHHTYSKQSSYNSQFWSNLL